MLCCSGPRPKNLTGSWSFHFYVWSVFLSSSFYLGSGMFMSSSLPFSRGKVQGSYGPLRGCSPVRVPSRPASLPSSVGALRFSVAPRTLPVHPLRRLLSLAFATNERGLKSTESRKTEKVFRCPCFAGKLSLFRRRSRGVSQWTRPAQSTYVPG